MANRIKQPVSGRKIAKVPLIMQLEALECSAACLAMILAYYEKWIPIEDIRRDCGVSRDGATAGSIVKAAKYYGLEATGYKMEPEQLKKDGIFPCIIHWNFNHFVVLDGFRHGKAYLNDPSRGHISVDMQEFDESFTGVCLVLYPGEDFEKSGKRTSVFSFIKNHMSGTWATVAFVALASVITSVIAALNPSFLRFYMDEILIKQRTEFMMPLFIILGVLYVIWITVEALTESRSIKISAKLASVGNCSYIWKILHLPMNFFSQRMAGDLLQRKEYNAEISYMLTFTLAPLIINSVMMFLYIAVMLNYSVFLTVIGIGSVLINAYISTRISKKRVNITRVSVRDRAKLWSASLAGIDMIETIKSNGSECGFFAKWAGYHANVNEGDLKLARLNCVLGTVPDFISMAANYAVLTAGVYFTIKGEYTPGMILAFQGVLQLFMEPAQSFINAGQSITEMRTKMERLNDVMNYPDDDSFSEASEDEGDFKKLSGEIEIDNVVFGYSPLSRPVLDGVTIKIKQGESIAIVGKSGSGKSTLAKVVSGLFSPQSGEVRFDGKRISEINKSVFCGSVSVVDQDIALFSDSVENNIKMWDKTVEDFEMILAARDAGIHECISSRTNGYRTQVRENGKNFSGGERQRMEIARVLASDPTVVILDEATSALDAITEHEMFDAVRKRGVTSIIIAHRLSTVRSCDRIIVLDEGKIVSSGTHDELMENCGLYRDIVIND